jgi:hypothetical protein
VTLYETAYDTAPIHLPLLKLIFYPCSFSCRSRCGWSQSRYLLSPRRRASLSPATRREQQRLQSQGATVERRRSVEYAGLQAKWRPLGGVVSSPTLRVRLTMACTTLTAGTSVGDGSDTPSFFRRWDVSSCGYGRHRAAARLRLAERAGLRAQWRMRQRRAPLCMGSELKSKHGGDGDDERRRGALTKLCCDVLFTSCVVVYFVLYLLFFFGYTRKYTRALQREKKVPNT